MLSEADSNQLNEAMSPDEKSGRMTDFYITMLGTERVKHHPRSGF